MQEVWQDKVNALIESTNLPLPACHAVGIWENPLAIPNQKYKTLAKFHTLPISIASMATRCLRHDKWRGEGLWLLFNEVVLCF